MDKNEKLIMTVKKDILFKDSYFQGFERAENRNYESRIISNFQYLKRGLVEKDPTYKQPIVYSILVNPGLKRIFAYQRSKLDEKYGEKRLQGKWSWGVGGHIERMDVNKGNPIIESMLREIKEEVDRLGEIRSRILGYLNDDCEEVGRVHFGIVYIHETDSEEVIPKDSEIDNGKLRTVMELEEICANPEFDVEGWSRIALQPLKEYLMEI